MSTPSANVYPILLPIQSTLVICIRYTTVPAKDTKVDSVTIDWDDGNIETTPDVNSLQKCHTYQNHGTYTITVIAMANGAVCGSGALPPTTV